MPRRKCFISYHHADDAYVRAFVNTFDHSHDVFIVRRLGEMPDDIINSKSTDYVMSRIKSDYIADSTVTIVLMGACTWARKYVDWEIQSSLRTGETIIPNGLLGIKLPNFRDFPPRFALNLLQPGVVDCYARWIDYPTSTSQLDGAIEAAYELRFTHSKYIRNPRDRHEYNRACP